MARTLLLRVGIEEEQQRDPDRAEIPCPSPTCGSGEEDMDPKDSREIPGDPASRDSAGHSLAWRSERLHRAPEHCQMFSRMRGKRAQI